jgi:hypothetical protein
VIDLTDLIKHFLGLGKSGHTFSRLINLVFGKATIEIKENAIQTENVPSPYG